MALHIEIPSSLESRLVARASELGVQPVEYVNTLIERDLPAPASKPLTGAELIEGWKKLNLIGLFADRPDSPEFAADLRKEAQERH